MSGSICHLDRELRESVHRMRRDMEYGLFFSKCPATEKLLSTLFVLGQVPHYTPACTESLKNRSYGLSLCTHLHEPVSESHMFPSPQGQRPPGV